MIYSSRKGSWIEPSKSRNQSRRINSPWPPSLCKAGDMRSGNKADLLHELESMTQPPEGSPEVTALILDAFPRDLKNI